MSRMHHLGIFVALHCTCSTWGPADRKKIKPAVRFVLKIIPSDLFLSFEVAIILSSLDLRCKVSTPEVPPSIDRRQLLDRPWPICEGESDSYEKK